VLQRSWIRVGLPVSDYDLDYEQGTPSLEVKKEDGTLLANRDLSVQRPTALRRRVANRQAWRFDDGMSNLLSTLRAQIVGVPKASTEQPLRILDSPLGFGSPPPAVTRRKYARNPLKVGGGRARARKARRDERGRFTK
jgi:hypothetical protein